MDKFLDLSFQRLKDFLGEAVEILSWAIVLAIIIRIFLCAPYVIPSRSMSPILQPGDRVLVDKLFYRFGEPVRGDIVVLKLPLDERIEYIKRIIALPGETIEGKNNRVYIDGKVLPEGYLPQGIKYDSFGPVRLEEEEYFVMGDNRADSQDSRIWGALNRKNIKGKAMCIYWPCKRITWLKMT
ncbi:MAG: signal peptidase I [Bacillota bacterium]